MKKILILAFTLSFLLCSECFAAFREMEFGRYYQNANSKELLPVEWLVLEENESRILLMTKKCVDEIPYNGRRENVTWENCSLRQWLNNEFFNTAFTDEEKASIIPAVLSDKVFALSREEVLRYLPDETDRQCVPTEHSLNRGTYVNGSGLCAWWTRDEDKNSQAVYLSSYGTFGNRPHYVDENIIGVRPAIRVRKNFSETEAERFLYSVKPSPQKAYEIETKLQPVLEQKAPFNVKELYDYFLKNPQKAVQEFDRKRIEVKGVVLRKGPDRAFGQPSIELSDAPTGKCYVLCVFQDESVYNSVKLGDEISVRGNYLVVYEGYGIVLKISELI